MEKYSVVAVASENDLVRELFKGDVFCMSARNGLDAIQGFINHRGMAYGKEMIAFKVKSVEFDPPVSSNDIEAGEWDFWAIDDNNQRIEYFTSVCTVVQTEFPF